MIIEIYTIICWFIFGSSFLNIFTLQTVPHNKLKNSLFCGISIGFGIGISSLIYFLFSLILSVNSTIFIFSEAFIVLVLIVLLMPKNIWFWKKNYFSDKLKNIQSIDIIFTACIICAIIIFIFELFQNPYGRWDAWEMWNLKAKWLSNGNGWTNIFSSTISHPDYPILVPLSVSRIWTFRTNFPIFDSVLVAFAFFSSIILIEYGALRILTSSYQAKLAVILLIATPFFIIDAAGLCADIPLSFYFLSFFITYAIAKKIKANNLIILSGFSLGFATWTKNEGLLFSFIVLFNHFLIMGYKLGIRVWLREFCRICIGFIPLFGTMLLMKHLYAPPNDLISSFNINAIIENCFELERHLLIMKFFAFQLLNIGGWFFQIPLILFLFSIIVGFECNSNNKHIYYMFIITILFMLFGYYIVFLLTPYNLSWHLERSLNRLIIQLWPSFVFVYFYSINPIGFGNIRDAK